MSKKYNIIKSRNRKNIRSIRLGVVIAILLMFLSIGGVYAWFTASDTHTNSFKGTQLIAEIDEVFMPNNNWQPGETTTKEVRIKNTGESSAFVRVSLYEFFLNLQIDVTDQTGNGNLKTSEKIIKPTVDEENIDTWKPAAEGHGTYTKGKTNYIADRALVSDPKGKIGMYEYNSPEREKSVLRYLTLNFSESLKETSPSKPSKKWVYENGYFYYLIPLQPGEESEPLLKSIALSDSIPNKYKGSLYKLKVYMDAHDQTLPLVDSWKLDKNGAVYPLIHNQLK